MVKKKMKKKIVDNSINIQISIFFIMSGNFRKIYYKVENVEKGMFEFKKNSIGVWKTFESKNGKSFFVFMRNGPRHATILKSTEGISFFCIELKKGDFYEIAGSRERKTCKKDMTFRVGI